MATSPTTVVAFLASSEDDRRAVNELAIETAGAAEARLILYEEEHGGVTWSPAAVGGEGSLSADDLETLGATDLAKAVRTARRAGIDATGWLGSAPTTDAFESFLEGVEAEIVVLPTKPESGTLALWQARSGSSALAAHEHGAVLLARPADEPPRHLGANRRFDS